MPNVNKSVELKRVFNFNRYEPEIVALKPGSVVKVNCNKESFWIELTECHGASPGIFHADGHRIGDPSGPTRFKGRVSNHLICDELGFDDIIEFDLSHIIGTWQIG